MEASSYSHNGTPVAATPRVLDARMQERLERAIQGKLSQGYRIEDQDESQAVLVTNSRRWFGLFGGGQTRELATINKWGYPSIERL